VAKCIATEPFYHNEIFCRYFVDDFTMEVPSAPPGMPTYFSTWEAERCFEWLNRSVREWEGSIVKFYPTPDADIFWVESQIDADVFWGEQDGHFSSESFMRIEFLNGKVKFIKWYFNTWAMLMAAGKRVHSHCLTLPKDEDGKEDRFNEDFLINLSAPEIDQYMSNPAFGDYLVGDGNDEVVSEESKEEIYRRRQINIYQFAAGIYREECRHMEILSPDYKKNALFVTMPGEKDPIADAESEEEARRFFAWNKLCSPWMYRDPRSKFYPTDDPNVFFLEMNAHGPGCWRTRSVTTGHYKENYLVRLTVDDVGRLVSFEEILVPINQLNSTGSEVPNFPYYH
jgi:hypothetical protein